MYSKAKALVKKKIDPKIWKKLSIAKSRVMLCRPLQIVRARSRKDVDVLYHNGKFVIKYDDQIDNAVVSLPCKPGTDILNSAGEIIGYFQADYIHEGSTVVDAGAYPGDFTVVASRMVGSNGRVYAFEPHPEHYDYMHRVLDANETDNVTLVPAALYSEDGVKTLEDNGMGSRIIGNGFKPKKHYTARTTTLDSFFEKQFPKDLVIKMDIEGAELEALEGAQDVIQRLNPKMMIASYHEIGSKRSCEYLEEMLAGMNVSHKYPAHLTTYAHRE
ncbi:FkbM family methyltransferase [Candidatus Woesearchaeota archaeon]|nr:FkbM family methyltransferase [Candidatus Woesearchaeota archaeon]